MPHEMCYPNNVIMPHELVHGCCLEQARIAVTHTLHARAFKDEMPSSTKNMQFTLLAVALRMWHSMGDAPEHLKGNASPYETLGRAACTEH